jgi:hypothetical protein
LVPYSSKVGVLLLLLPEPTVAVTLSALSPTMRITYAHSKEMIRLMQIKKKINININVVKIDK